MYSEQSNRQPTFGFYGRFYRNLAWCSGLPPYRGVPHLNGYLSTGQWPYLQDENGLLDTVLRASKLAGKSDTGMCSFWVKSKLVLLIQNPSDVHDFKRYCEKYIYRNVDYWDLYPGVSAIGSEGKIGLNVRKAYGKFVFNHKALLDLIPKINNVCESYILKLKLKKNFESKYYFRKFAVELATQLFMGLDNHDSIDSDGVVNYLSRLLSRPFMDINLLGFQLQAESGENDKFIEEMEQGLRLLFLNQYENKIKTSDNLFHSLWKLGKEIKRDDRLTAKNLFPDAFFFIAGGAILTLGDSLTSIIKCITTYPGIEKKLLQEINKKIEEDTLELEKIDQLTYLDMVIKEVFRMFPPVPVIPIRAAKTSFTFKDITVKEGDCILISPYICHHAPSVWEEPKKFIPERFSKKNEKNIPLGAYLPFGEGSRSCIGEKYAMKVLKIFIVKLFREFRVKRVENSNQTKLDGPSLIFDTDIIQLVPRELETKVENYNHLLRNY